MLSKSSGSKEIPKILQYFLVSSTLKPLNSNFSKRIFIESSQIDTTLRKHLFEGLLNIEKAFFPNCFHQTATTKKYVYQEDISMITPQF